MMASSPVITVDSSAAKGLALSAATGALRIVGAGLAAHGATLLGSEVTASSGVIAEQVVGVALAIGGQLWAWWREKQHSKLVNEVASALPTQVVVK